MMLLLRLKAWRLTKSSQEQFKNSFFINSKRKKGSNDTNNNNNVKPNLLINQLAMTNRKARKANKGKETAIQKGDAEMKCRMCKYRSVDGEKIFKHLGKFHKCTSVCPDCFAPFFTTQQEVKHEIFKHAAPVDPLSPSKGYQENINVPKIKCPVEVCRARYTTEKKLCFHVGKKHEGATMCPNCFAVFLTADDITQHAPYEHQEAVDPLTLAGRLEASEK